MNIHFMPNQKFSKAFIQLLNEYPLGENKLFLYGKDKFIKEPPQKNVFIIDDFRSFVSKDIDQCNRVFLHGFYERSLIRFIYSLRKRLKNRLTVIAWGADIYNGRFLLKSKDATLREKLSQARYEYFKRCIVKKANVFMTFASPDMEILKKHYGARGKHVDCLYPSNVDKEYLNEILSDNVNNTKVRVMLGNSASRTNNHIDMLNILSRFKGKIEVICPLSYGDFDYAGEVKKKGMELFGKDFISIDDYFSPREYSRLLNNLDIAIFNNNRQEATGNIEILGYLKKKIFLRSDTSLWGHYVVRDKCKMFDALNIKNLSFESFCLFDEEQGKYNNNYFAKIWDDSYIKSLWDEVLC